MKQFLLAVFVFAVLVLLIPTSCYYDNEVEQYGITTCDTVAMSYSQDIRPIIDANCVSCHAPGGQQESSPFDTYDGLKNYADNRKIVNRVNGVGAIMPPSGAISKCDQLKIEAWVNAGALDN